MMDEIRIEDHTIWFKHISDPDLRKKLERLRPDEAITLATDGVIGKWRRMRVGKDGRQVMGIKPEGAMKTIWNEWFQKRKGERVGVAVVHLADEYLAAGSALFSEWSSPEDEEAWRDL